MKETRTKTQDHLVSIIIPVYNKAAFLRETLDSALGQTYANIEMVLVNDGSTDESLTILEEYYERHPGKIVLVDQRNGGVSKATNIGIKASRGEYIQFLDADDLLSADKIANQIRLLEVTTHNVIASCEWVLFKEFPEHFSRVPYGVFRDFNCGMDLLLMFWNQQEMMQPASYLTHRLLIERVGPWDESLSINQDGEFFARALLCADKIIFEPQGKAYYRTPGETNVSQQKSENAMISLLKSIQCYEREILKIEDSIRVKTALKKVYQKFIYDVFPQHPELVKHAKDLSEGLGIRKRTFIGGPKFQQLSKLIGFENALRLKRFLQ